MANNAQTTDWLDSFPELKAIEDPVWHSILPQIQLLRVPKDAQVFREGDACSNYLLVVSGSVRVQKLSESGREIVLYRVESGQSCVLTTSCMLAHDRYTAEAISETEVEAIAIPFDAFQQALAGSQAFREFIFASYGRRITSLVMLIDAIAFGRMDSRLAQRLLTLAGTHRELQITHNDLARELGTAREVISRLLKDFEQRGWVELYRGRIELTDVTELQKLADTPAK